MLTRIGARRTPDPSGPGVRSRLPATDWHVLIPILAVIPVATSSAPIDDVDSYWHVVIGGEILATRTVRGLGSAWAWYDPPEPWTTSQWLSEAAMAGLVRLGGWDALVYITVFLAIGLAMSAAWLIFRRASGRRAVLLMAVASVSLVPWIQVRPATFSLLAIVFIADAAERLLTEGRLPRWWVIPLVAIWANIHGLWVLAPAAIALASLLYWLAAPSERRGFVLRASAFVALLAAAGSLTPLGPQGLILPLLLRDATTHIDEWQPVVVLSWVSLPLLAVGAVLVLNWTRRQKPSAGEVVFALAWVAFAVTAQRNTLVGALMLLPLAARSIGTTPASWKAVFATPFGRIGTVATSAVAVLVVLAGFARVDPLAETTPLAIALRLTDDYQTVRVLNHYNSAGVLAAFGPAGIELGIDGRAERYGRDYIDRYLDTFALRGEDWSAFLDEFDPEVAVIKPRDPIRHLLIDDWGWTVVLEDDPYILVAPS